MVAILVTMIQMIYIDKFSMLNSFLNEKKKKLFIKQEHFIIIILTLLFYYFLNKFNLNGYICIRTMKERGWSLYFNDRFSHFILRLNTNEKVWF